MPRLIAVFESCEQVASPDGISHAVGLMYTCGMYNFSGTWPRHCQNTFSNIAAGEFAFLVGLPAKSGVSGDLLLVVPGVMGIAVWSPRLEDSNYRYQDNNPL